MTQMTDRRRSSLALVDRHLSTCACGQDLDFAGSHCPRCGIARSGPDAAVGAGALGEVVVVPVAVDETYDCTGWAVYGLPPRRC